MRRQIFAARLGARLCRFEWRADFPAARNAGLDAASCNWILSIDADEVWKPGLTLTSVPAPDCSEVVGEGGLSTAAALDALIAYGATKQQA